MAKVLKPRTPADYLGFTEKCCCCLPLKPAAFIICMFSLIWSVAELVGAERQVVAIFPTREGTGFFVTKVVYLVLSFGLLLTSCLLFFGIIKGCYNLLNVYIWYVCLFTVVFIGVAVAGVVSAIMRGGKIPRPDVARVLAAAVWICLVVYFIIVINSFKYTLW